jgi:hypothetical protein
MARRRKSEYGGFSKKQLLLMKELWYGNNKLSTEKIKEKWSPIMKEECPFEFISKLENAIKTSKEKIKSIYSIEGVESKNWEYAADDTIKALTRSYLTN